MPGFATPASPAAVTTPIEVPISTSAGVIKMTREDIFISYASIFLPRYSGVRPTMSPATKTAMIANRSEEHTSELQSRLHLVCRLLLEKKKKKEKRPDYHHEQAILSL